MAAISLKGIEKRYGDVMVVKHLDLEIHDGELVVLVGPSGCGKSTTLRMIAGLETVSGGELLIDGVRVNDTAPGDRDLAMVFQSYALYPHMSVRENIAFGLRIRKLGAAEVEARVVEAAAALGLSTLLERKPRQLSGGQRQRVAMARAIVRRPKAFLFDEPLSNLDAKLRLEVRAEIAALRRRTGTTTVYVTHDQVEAMTLADRIVVLDGGVAQQVGAPLDLYRKPANAFVATFLGTPTMVLLEAARAGAAAPPGAQQVGARPHDARARAPAAPTPAEAVRLGEIDVEIVERLGQESFAFGRLAGASAATARVGALLEDDAAKAGARLAIDVPRDRLHFFDAQGQRLG
ncbi:MAG: sn-glycerol-3-phosphate ABC transporter ATP-binding protein UgpC [Deltaproteobacteria bacterium]|nr:sn-glycerol-3-phosphate ABC transporter ATP-binding protein UgpC [Deltaproteobacteria bacterium]